MSRHRTALDSLIGLAVVIAVLVGAPAAHATLSWDTAAHDFGSQNVGTSASKTFTLTATCDSPDVMMMTQCGFPPSGFHFFGPPAVSGDGFTLGTPNTCSAGNLMTPSYPGSPMTCSSTVVFTPTTAGSRAGLLATPSGPDIALGGTGIALPTPTPTTSRPAKKKCKKKRRAAAAKKCKKRK